MAVRTVGIIGGGVGGLAVANALQRKGLSVKLFERAPFFSPTVGAGFGISPNGIYCLHALGFGEAISKEGVEFHNILVQNDKGKVLVDSDFFKKFKERHKIPMKGMIRANLINILESPLKETGAIFYKKTLSGLKQDRDGVNVEFTDGHKEKFDILIGADGIKSTVANLVFTDHPKTYYYGASCIYGVFETPAGGFKHPNLGRPNTIMQSFGEGEFITFPAGNPAKPTYVWAQLYCGPEPEHKPSEWENAEKVRERLSAYFTHLPADHPAHEAFDLTDSKRFLHFPLYFREIRKEWTKGRVTLLGDSAHAVLPFAGQGANQALEDALVLSEAFTEANFDHEKAYQLYFKARVARTDRISRISQLIGKISHVGPSRLKQWVRDAILPGFYKESTVLGAMEKEVMDFIPKKEDRLRK